VGAVRVVEMQPEKKRASRSSLQPGERMGYALPGAPVDQTDILLLEGRRRKRIIVKIEATRQAPTAVEHEGADHGSGGIACLFECLSDGSKLWSERLPGEILHAILKWISAGQNHRMGRPGQWNLRNGALKHYPVVSQRVEGWSLDHLRSITSHVIGAQGIDGDQYNAGSRKVTFRNVGLRARFRGRVFSLSLRESGTGRQSDHDRESFREGGQESLPLGRKLSMRAAIALSG